MLDQNIIATIDLGSNSFRLLISRDLNGHLQIVDSIKDMIHFAAGLDKNKMLDEASQERALKCLQKFNERLRGFKPSQVRAVATNTFRVARNIQAFLIKAEQALGFPIEIIGGHEEARLIYTGIVHTIPFKGKKALIVDIGGGSTEFAIGNNLQPEITESLSMGCVSYSVTFFKNDIINQKNFDMAVNTAKSKIQRIRKLITSTNWDFAIGSSGTAKAIRDLSYSDEPQKETLSYDFLIETAKTIIKSGGVTKAKFKNLKANRVEVFAGGLAIMIAIFEELNITEMTVTDAGLRDGVLYDLIGRKLDKDLRDETVSSFQKRYLVDLNQAQRIEQVAISFFKALNKEEPIKNFHQWKTYLIWASKLHEIGLSISHTGYHKHSAYIIENADMSGFSRTNQQTVASIILGHRGNLRKMETLLDSKEMCHTIISIRLAAIFCRARNAIFIPINTTIKFNMKKRQCILTLDADWMKENLLTASILDDEIQLWKEIDYDFIIELS